MMLMEHLSDPCILQEAADEEAALESNEGSFSDASKCTDRRVLCAWAAPVLKVGKQR